MDAWIAEELKTVDLGDERLDRRFEIVLERLAARPSVSIPAACQGLAETQAAYRFFDNDRVEAKKYCSRISKRRWREFASMRQYWWCRTPRNWS
jgi:hypothetical protein